MPREVSAIITARAPSLGFLASPTVMGGCYAAAAILTAAAIALGSSPGLTGPLGPASPVVLALLGFDLLMIPAPASLLAWRLWLLLGAQGADAGARLHLRFVALFALAAVAPAVIVALFFGVLVTRGVDSWFSARVQTVVENSATVARSYVEEQKDYIGGHMAVMARDLDQAAPTPFRHPGGVFPLPGGPRRRQRVFRPPI